MKQVTGNNPSEATNKVSIQLKLGGHSFSVDTTTLPAGEFLCCVLTDKCTLLPQECFDESLAENYLRICGMACNEDEIALATAPQAGVIALMAIAKRCLEQIRQSVGARAHFTTPLLRDRVFPTPTIWLCRYDKLVYIKVYNKGLRFAEVIQSPNATDLLYAVTQLVEEFSDTIYTICVEGNESKTTQKLFKHYFKQVICAS